MVSLLAKEKQKRAIKLKTITPANDSFVSFLPRVSSLHFSGWSEIGVENISTGNWDPIAKIAQSTTVDAQRTAEYIARAVNDHEEMCKLANELTIELELCRAREALGWKAEKQPKIVISPRRKESV